MTGEGIIARVGNDYLYRSPTSGREAWVIFNQPAGTVAIVTDVYGRGQPYNAVEFTAAHLRAIADDLDRHRSGHVYLSTSCLHAELDPRPELHDYCAGTAGSCGTKEPARCKFCPSRCVCPCHATSPAAEPGG